MKSHNLNRQKNIAAWVFISPALILFLCFMVWPIIDSFFMSFYFIRGERQSFVGLGNYVRLMQDTIFWKSVWNMFTILIIQVPIMLFLSMLFASILNNPLLKFKGLFRVSIFLPTVTSLVAYSIIFFMMLSFEGVINSLLKSMAIGPFNWLDNPILAKLSIILAITWRWTGYNMIIFLAALQNIPYSLYEAASIDGAKAWQKFLFITVPQLKPVILFTAILSTIGTIQLFDEPMNLTKGGPSDATLSPTMYLYNTAFKASNVGYGAAIAWGIVVLVVILAIVQFKVIGKDD
ncbi:MAG: carbohydrate ABC transporter permease [Alphaproteobacteria bacterium]